MPPGRGAGFSPPDQVARPTTPQSRRSAGSERRQFSFLGCTAGCTAGVQTGGTSHGVRQARCWRGLVPGADVGQISSSRVPRRVLRRCVTLRCTREPGAGPGARVGSQPRTGRPDSVKKSVMTGRSGAKISLDRSAAPKYASSVASPSSLDGPTDFAESYPSPRGTRVRPHPARTPRLQRGRPGCPRSSVKTAQKKQSSHVVRRRGPDDRQAAHQHSSGFESVSSL